MDELLNQPVVLDNGSGIIKAGFSGEERPKIIEPTIIGNPKYSKIMAGALDTDEFIGSHAQEHRGVLKLRHPMQHGVVTNWQDMESIWSHILTKKLSMNLEDHPILITEAPLNPRRNRELTGEVFFETFNSPALYVSIQAVLSLYASGRTTGVVLDSGDGVTHVVPIYQGFSINSAIQRADIAGRDVTESLQMQLRKMGFVLNTSSEFEIVRIIKEKCCYVSKDVKHDEATVQEEQFRLPDGKVIKLGAERFRSTEILFRPDLAGVEADGIHDMLFQSISKADMDLRDSLYGGIVLSGGSTCFRGFGERLLKELRQTTDSKIKIFAPPERQLSCWIGGSILSGLSTFKKMWVSKQEWLENPDLLHTRCM